MRFSEFNVCWTTYKLETCAKIYDGTHQTPKYTKSGIRFISVENISNLYDSQKFISLEDFKKEFKIHPQINDILMTRIGDIGTPAVVSKEDPLAYYVSLALIRPLKNLYYLYIYDYIQTPYFKKELWHRTLHIAFPQKINKEEIGKCKISIPCEKEQFKIGNFLSLLDQRIYTQSKIIEDLELFEKEINNTIINKLVEYKDLVKFSSIYNFAKEGGTPNTSHPEYYTKGSIPFVKIDDLTTKYLVCNQSFITKLGLENSSAWLIPANSILYSNGATIGAISINKYPVTTKQGILGIVPKSDYLSEYLYYFLRSNYFKKEICKITTQGTMKSAYIKDIDNILVPRINKNQQNEILTLLSEITLKIQQEKDILELYKKQKAYLLKNMFI